MKKEEKFDETATRVSMTSIIGNAALSAAKLIVGIAAHSGAMVSDAVHSASDVFSSIIVIIGVKMSVKEADREHPYGHERFECVAAVVLAAVLAATGLMIGYQAVLNMGNEDAAQTVPGLAALIMALVSIVVKEIMFWYTRGYAKQLNSSAMMADAWHHRSDALSSVGAFVGILGARMGYPVMETMASLFICAFILKAAYDIFNDAVTKMVDHACDRETEDMLSRCVMEEKEVLGIDRLQTREFGNRIYVDLEIRLEGSMPLVEAHGIAERVHDRIEKEFPNVKHIMVHVNPDREN